MGLDIVAGLSISAALAFGETLAAGVVALMYAGGQLLEDYAANRARADMKALLARVPKTALRYDDGHLEEVAIDAIRPGDRLLIRQGDIVPVDGRVSSGRALLDMAALTGESVPVSCREGQEVQSGARSLDTAFDMMATRPAAESTYAGIVRLVQAAQAAKAPMVRLADRYALVFLAVTVALAGGTWFFTGDHIRMLAVLVSATPCPLILAVPVAIISGMGKAARRGVLMKGGPVLETMARADEPRHRQDGHADQGQGGTRRHHSAGPWTGRDAAACRLAGTGFGACDGSLDRCRGAGRGLTLAYPADVHETAGEGLEGLVDGHRVIVGGHDFVARQSGPLGAAAARARARNDAGGAGHLRAARRPSAAGRCGAAGNAAGAGTAAAGGHQAHRAGFGRCTGRGRPGGRGSRPRPAARRAAAGGKGRGSCWPSASPA